MNEAETIHKLILPYLHSLGYSESLIRHQVRTNQGRIVDMVVYSSPEEPLIVVEAKSSRIDLPKQDESTLRFDPLVRQTHLYAKELKARYFLVTNGLNYLWFTTDAAGRPQLIPEHPQNAPFAAADKKINTRTFLTDSFLRLRDYKYSTEDIDIPLLLILKLMQDRENIDTQTAFRKLEDRLKKTPLLNGIFDLERKLSLSRVTSILEQFDLTKFSHSDLLSSVDSIFIVPNLRSREFRISRWLADFMIQLAQLSQSSRVVDLFCGFGDILAAAKLSNAELGPNSTVGYTSNQDMGKWAILQQYILGQDLHNIIIENALHFSPNDLKATHIVFAPPFGGKISDYIGDSDLFENGIRHYEDILLEKAIRVVGKQNKGRIVVLVPENMLFMQGRRAYTRKFILDNLDIRGIISLQQGALAPYGVKSSILVLDSKSEEKSYNVFMAHADQFPEKNAFHAHESTQLVEILQAFRLWSADSKNVEDSDSVWEIKSDSIDIDNFSVTSHRPRKGDLVSFLNFETVPLSSLATFISRGRAIKLDDKGIIKVIGPGAIRVLNIDNDGILTTTEENIPPNPLTVQSDDILMNNIGSYLGQSAVAERELDGTYVSQHVMIIRCNRNLITPDYLAIALNSDFVRSQLLKKSSGTLMPSNSRRGLETIDIPLPSLAIQKLIVQKIYTAKSELVNAQRTLNKFQDDFNKLLGNPFDTGEYE